MNFVPVSFSVREAVPLFLAVMSPVTSEVPYARIRAVLFFSASSELTPSDVISPVIRASSPAPSAISPPASAAAFPV